MLPAEGPGEHQESGFGKVRHGPETGAKMGPEKEDCFEQKQRQGRGTPDVPSRGSKGI